MSPLAERIIYGGAAFLVGAAAALLMPRLLPGTVPRPDDGEREAERVVGRSERLQEFTAQLIERVGAQSVARAIVDEGRLAIGATAAAVAVARHGGQVAFMAAHGYDEKLLTDDAPLYRASTPLDDVLNGGGAVWLGTRQDFIERYPEVLPFIDPRHNSWVALPLDANQRRVGALALSFAGPGPFSVADRSFMLMFAQQCAQALERARLNELELQARVNAEFAERRLSFLGEASTRLAASLDYVTTLSDLATVAVPEIADWCIVHLTDLDGVPRMIAAVHSNPDRVALRQEIERRYPARTGANSGYGRVLRTGEPEYLPHLDADHVRAAAEDDEHFEMLRSLGLRSGICVPIMADGRVSGALTLANAESGRVFSESDLTLALELGVRAGQAVQNARLYEVVRHASDAKSDFLAVMSHELRTPLNAIIGYSDLLLLGVPDDVPARARRQVERIRSASTSLLHLVEEVLSFSRIEAGKEDIRISPVDLSAVTRECVAMIEPLAGEKDLAIVLQEPPQALKAVTDERKVRQILTNLLSNAVKFTEEGTITVAVSSSDDEITVRVSDTGIGIPAEHLERIFEPFWQVEQSATRRFGGTGLGLGVARKLSRLLEGRLVVESRVGQGSTFALVLPRRTPGMGKPA
ncbi:MAG: GAF domain-containing sensor histidine kinase [Gemmatimonadota bacterium]